MYNFHMASSGSRGSGSLSAGVAKTNAMATAIMKAQLRLNH
jgi:hypothetical protein